MSKPITIAGKNKIEKELEHLIKVERAELQRAIAEARAQGDLSENADYKFAKEKQSHVEGKIKQLQGILANCREINVSEIRNEKIVFGATVTLYDDSKSCSVTYQVVGDDEADIKINKISYNSPLGKALMGKEDGDAITVKAPKGDREYEIESIKYI